MDTIRRTRGTTLDFIADTPYDLTGYTISAQVRDAKGTLLGAFTTVVTTNPKTNLPGRITLALATASMPVGESYFDIKLTSAGGKVTYTEKVRLELLQQVTV